MKDKPNTQLATGNEPSIALMLEKVIDKGVTVENVAALQSMVDLYKSVKRDEAEKLYNSAFSKLQGEMPHVEATRPVPGKNGTIRYHYANHKDIMAVIQSHLTNNGFSLSFSARAEDNRIVAICTLMHEAGHSRSSEFGCRVGGGPPGEESNLAKADKTARSMAKTAALCDILNIPIDDYDDDARMAGKPIGKALAEDLQARVKKCGANEQAFLKFAGVAANDPAKAEDYEQISDARYGMLNELLERKERGKGKKNAEGEYDF